MESRVFLSAQVIGRHVFYNASAFDGGNLHASASDDAAIAPDKVALLPGGRGAFANYTSYSKGINGLIIDVAGLAGTPVAADFSFKVGNVHNLSSWQSPAGPSEVLVRRGAGEAGSDRITLTWPDNAIRNKWLQVTVLPTANTGLESPDIFYFGHLQGETGNVPGNATVTAFDLLATRRNVSAASAPIDSRWDFDRNGRVDRRDFLLARAGLTGKGLRLLNVIRARLQNDTGRSAGDGLTADPSVTGRVPDVGNVTALRGGFDATPGARFGNLLPDLNADGTFSLSGLRLSDLARAPLADGVHVLHLQATYGTGVATADLSFTLDATPPAPALALATASQNGSPNHTRLDVVTLAGMTEPGAALTLSTTAATTAAGDGSFSFANVPVPLGQTLFTITATDAAGNVGSGNAIIFHDSAVRQSNDVALEWYGAALSAIERAASTPEFASRALAIVSAAAYDAANSVSGSGSSLFVRVPSAAGASDVAAVARAARDALAYLYPSQVGSFDTLLSAHLAAIPDPQSASRGADVGRQVAVAIIAMRARDGAADSYAGYTPVDAPGAWEPTYPAYLAAENPQWATVAPFLLDSPSQFRPDGPPSLASAQGQADYEQVRSIGSVTSATRTADQTLAARFWNDPTGTATPPGHWNMIARAVASQRGLDLAGTTRLFAQLNVAMADAAIATWDAKYAYNFWRPITAIAEGGGNASLAADPGWRPLLTTPPFPEYTSGHSAFSAAAAAVLGATFGPDTPFTINTTSPAVPAGTTRSFSGFEQAAAEAAMSRIYGGIHFNAAVQAGFELGRQIARLTLDRFADVTDVVAPVVTFDAAPGRAANGAFDVTGLATDNLSGVQSLTARFDDGAPFAVTVDAAGRFAINADINDIGPHVLELTAVDRAGNTSAPRPYEFTVDGAAPAVFVAAPGDSAALALDARLTGSADGTGSPLTVLNYRFDGGAATPLVFDAAGAFDQYLNLTTLSPGPHSLTVSATDAAGNAATRTVDVTMPTRPAVVVGVTPEDGSGDVGATFRPQVIFSRPVDAATLTSAGFFLSDSAGAKLPATVVVSDDATRAYLFPAAPLPSAATVTVTLDGHSVRTPDGAPVDAALTQKAGGSVLTWRFTTVSLTPIQGTSIGGTVADPGPDLRPGTKDDVQIGPDGITGTADDVYRLPLAGVTVSILGTGLVTVTDAAGKFFFPTAPAGTIKLDVDGNTAVAPPANYYFPSMVMDLFVNAGAANTVMAAMQATGMGNAPAGAAAPTAPGVYLPRVATAVLTPVGPSGVTTVGLKPVAAPELTNAQREALSLEVPAGAAVGANGQRLADFQVGVSAVPPQLVADMMPPGVMQHTFDITVQAPGVAAFTTPVPMTFPNVFGAAPGTHLDFLSFDHTTGRLVIEGTATVSADGLSVRTDPGTGITHPGWHGVTPPGICGGSGGPPPAPQPPPKPTDFTITHQPERLETATGDADFFDLVIPEIVFTAPASSKPRPPAPPGCAIPPRPDDDPQSLTVEITVDGPLDDFLKRSGDLPLKTQTFTLTAGSGEKRVLAGEKKSYQEMLGAALRDLDRGRLYAASIKIKETTVKADGSRVIENRTYYASRFVDPYDDSPDGTMSFPDTLVGSTQKLEMALVAPKGVTFSVDGPFATSNEFGSAQVVQAVAYTPVGTGPVVGLYGVKAPGTNDFMALFSLTGVGLDPQEWFVSPADLKARFKLLFPQMDDAQKAAFGTLVLDVEHPENAGWEFSDARTDEVVNAVLGVADAAFQPYGTSIHRASAPTAGAVVFTNSAAIGPISLGYPTAIGVAFDAEISAPPFAQGLSDLLSSRPNLPAQAENYLLSRLLNPVAAGHIEYYVDRIVGNSSYYTREDFARVIGETIAHEVGHQVGMVHSDHSGVDIMHSSSTDSTAFTLVDPAMRVALGMPFSKDVGQSAVDFYQTYLVNGAGKSGGPGGTDGGEVDAPPVVGGLLAISTGGGAFPSAVNLGTGVLGGAPLTQALTLTNVGSVPVTVGAASFSGGDGQFTVSGVPAGQVLGPRQSATFSVTFRPSARGESAATLQVSNTGLDPATRITLRGLGLESAAYASVDAAGNNLGGARVGAAPASANEVATVTNFGATPLRITGVRVTEGATAFSLTGLPADLASTPVVLAPGESFSFGATFRADHLGIHRGTVQVSTNGPATPLLSFGLVGTGVAALPVAQWGDDFVSVTTRSAFGDNTVRVRSDAAGNFSMFLPPSTPYETTVFDPTTGLVAHGFGRTAPSGGTTDLSATLVFGASTAPDSDGDGLADDVENAVGTATNSTDTDRDGLSDLAEIEQGLDPFGGRVVRTGVVANLALQGKANEVVLEGSGAGGDGQLAYVATGAYGLAVVDASRFQQPQVLSQVDLPGDAVDVAVDGRLGVAAVAAGAGGLHLLDVSNPAAPLLLRTLAGSFNQVEVVDGVAYASTGPRLEAYDLLTGDPIESISTGGGAVRSVARERSFLYTVDGTGTLRVIDLSGGHLTARGSLATGAFNGALFAGGGIAYVGTGQGFVTVNVANPDAPALISGADANNLAGQAVVPNGSGLAVGVGTPIGPTGPVRALDLLNVSDPANTAGFLTRIVLPGEPESVAIGSGIAFVADGTSGLVVVNYLPFDAQGQAPSVTISAATADLDPAAPGVQVLEGATLEVATLISDDVQVRNVELLVNGQVVGNDVSFPFDLAAVALGAGGSTKIRVRATDTGGNQTLSNELSFLLLPDVTPPTVLSISPADGYAGAAGLRRVNVEFSEAMSPASLVPQNFRLVAAGPDGNFGTADDASVPFQLQTRERGRVVPLTFAALPSGRYRFTPNAALADRAGNRLAGATPSTFTLVAEARPFEVAGARPDIGVGSRPAGVEAGDLDGDGDSDLVTADTNSDTVSVLLSDGHGHFARAEYAVGDGPAAVALADVDRDGDLDLITANEQAGTVTVLTNDGVGGFGSRADVASGSRPSSLAVGDVDGDGDGDLIVGVPSGNVSGAALLRNNGVGVFGARQDINLGFEAGTNAVALGDIDGDRDLDLVITAQPDVLFIFRNNGAGVFGSRSEVQAGSAPRGLRLGDVDGDGDLDAVYGHANAPPGLSIMKNNGAGAFSGRVDFDLNAAVDHLALKDLDGDGDLDIAVPALSGSKVAVLRNDGLGAFPQPAAYRVGDGVNYVTAGDFDGDGDFDLATANTNSNSLSTLLNDGAAHFGTPLTPTGIGPFDVRVGDVDRDGDLDTVSVNFYGNSVSVLFNDGTGATPRRVDVGVGARPRSAALADVDGDGDLDLLVANSQATTVSVLRNDGAGAFSGRVDVPVGGSPRAVAAGDFDGDGDTDFATANTSGNASLLRNDGAGAFGAPASFAGGNFALVAGDVDRDGDLDLVAASAYTSNTARVLRNDGTGTFAAEGNIPVSTGGSLALGDVDRDGDLDLVSTSGYYGGSIAVMRNDGSGELAFSATREVIRLSLRPQAMVLADADGDGYLDIVATHFSNDSVSVLPNDRAGHFGAATSPSAYRADAFAFPTGRGPRGLAAGDLDGDGDADVVTADSSGHTVTLLRNDGAGRLGRVLSVAGTGPRALATADLDGDGHLDAVTANSGNLDRTVSILFGDGAGGFHKGWEASDGNIPTAVTPADVDGDGDLDVVWSTYLSTNGAVFVSFNDGDRNFSRSRQVHSGTMRPVALAVGDIDGDGDLDIVTADASNYAGPAVNVFVGDGAGGFTFRGGAPLTSAPQSVALTDADGDGDLDVATASPTANGATVLLNDGAGRFSSPSIYVGGPGFVSSGIEGGSATAVMVGDLDGDGDLDAVTPSPVVLVNNGRGAFDLSRADVGLGSSIGALGDVDGDGDLDLVTANSYSSSVSVLASQGGRFVDTGTEYPVGLRPWRVVLADVNGDRRPDVVTVNLNGSSVSVLLNDGAGGFAPRVDYPVANSPVSVSVKDVDGDGDADVVALGNAGFATVLKNDGTGAFGSRADFAAGTSSSAFALGDADGDGDADLVVANGTQANLLLLLNNGTGSFGAPTPLALATTARGVTLGDVDGDGDADVIATDSQNRRNYLLRNNGNGSFAPAVQFAASAGYGAPSLADMDADGDLDFVAGNEWSSVVTVLYNDGGGTFGGRTLYGTGFGPQSVTAADVDGDGDSDLITANTNTSTVSVLLNNGAGAYGPPVEFATGGTPRSVLAADVDGDGDADIVTANSAESGSISVLLNDGPGLYLTRYDFIVGGKSPRAVSLGDVDGDGDKDLIVVSEDGGTLAVLFVR